MDSLQEGISDDMTRGRRLSAMLKLTASLSTEDIELLNDRFPRLAECALHEFLNPEPQSIWDVSELRRMLGVKDDSPQCLAHWMPKPCLFCEDDEA